MLLVPKEIAPMLRVSERTVVRMFRKGALKGKQINGKLWVTRREIVDQYLAEDLGAPFAVFPVRAA